MRDRGAGLVGTVAGVTVFLAFLLFAVQLLANLYSTSVVTSAAHEAARMVATDPRPLGDPAQLARAEAHARQLLGRYGDRAALEWDLSDPEVVGLRVVVDNPRFLFAALDGALGFDTVDRTVRVRVEQPMPAGDGP